MGETAVPSYLRSPSSSLQSSSLKASSPSSMDNDSLLTPVSHSRELISLNLYSKDDNSNAKEDDSSWHSNVDIHRSLDNIEKIKGLHYADIHAGDPAQKQTLAVITSSDYNVLSSCSLGSPASLSRTFNTLQCDECSIEGSTCVADRCSIRGFILREENSWLAYEAMDFAYTGGTPLDEIADGSSIALTNGLPIIFGCQIQSAKFSNEILSKSDGIMGMSPSRTSFVNQMFANDKVAVNQFSLCFNRIRPDLLDIPETGTLTFGGYDSTHHSTPMVYAQNTRWKGASYSVYVKNIYLRAGGGQSVIPDSASQEVTKLKFDSELFNAVGHGVLIESSSPHTLLSIQIKDEFRIAWRTITGKEYEYNEVSLTKEELNSLPTIIFQLKASDIVSDNDFLDTDNSYGMIGTGMDADSPHDVLLAVPATQYMEYVKTSRKYRCRISLESNSGTTIGANFLQGKHINFDLDNSRIGFAEQTKCDQPIVKTEEAAPKPGFVMAKETGELATTPSGDGDYDSFSFNNIYIGAGSFLLLIIFVLIGTAIRKS